MHARGCRICQRVVGMLWGSVASGRWALLSTPPVCGALPCIARAACTARDPECVACGLMTHTQHPAMHTHCHANQPTYSTHNICACIPIPNSIFNTCCANTPCRTPHSPSYQPHSSFASRAPPRSRAARLPRAATAPRPSHPPTRPRPTFQPIPPGRASRSHSCRGTGRPAGAALWLCCGRGAAGEV